MKHFCTIITSDHLYKASALYDSLKKADVDVNLHVLVIDGVKHTNGHKNLLVYNPSQLAHLPNYEVITGKYGRHHDKFRWTLKPLFLQHLLQTSDKVIYLDADIYFFNQFDFLFELLDKHNVLLTPHYYSTDPTREQNWFEANFRVGLYNAGFIGANKSSLHLLSWWAACCAYRCEKNAFRGTFDDQKYLDLLPVMDENVHIVRHKGCNVADWNGSEIKRSQNGHGVLLQDKYPLIFIHFNNSTIRAIVKGSEPLLENYLNQYMDNLKIHNPALRLNDLYNEDTRLSKLKYGIWKFVTDTGLEL